MFAIVEPVICYENLNGVESIDADKIITFQAKTKPKKFWKISEDYKRLEQVKATKEYIAHFAPRNG